MTEVTQKFDWNEIVIIPEAGEGWHQGRQVLNFFPGEKDYRKSKAAVDFVSKYFQHAKPINTDAGLMRYASDQVSLS